MPSRQETVGDDAAAPLSLLLQRVAVPQTSRCSNRFTYWRDTWANASRDFERVWRHPKKGVAAVPSGNLVLAEKHFTEVAGDLIRSAVAGGSRMFSISPTTT